MSRSPGTKSYVSISKSLLRHGVSNICDTLKFGIFSVFLGACWRKDGVLGRRIFSRIVVCNFFPGTIMLIIKVAYFPILPSYDFFVVFRLYTHNNTSQTDLS